MRRWAPRRLRAVTPPSRASVALITPNHALGRAGRRGGPVPCWAVAVGALPALAPVARLAVCAQAATGPERR